jgi:plasmid stability protein
MPTLQVRDFPDLLLQQLKVRAEAARRSLTQQVIVELERAMQSPEQSERRDALQWMQETPFLVKRGRRKPVDFAALVREDRDR